MIQWTWHDIAKLMNDRYGQTAILIILPDARGILMLNEVDGGNITLDKFNAAYPINNEEDFWRLLCATS